MVRLQLKVSPKSSRDAILGWRGEQLKLAVRAAPDKGKANEAVRRLLARSLHLRRAEVRLVAGHASPDKLVELPLEPDELRRRLDARLAAAGDSATAPRRRR